MAATAPRSNDPIVIWEPQKGPQEALITCPVFEVFFGGARGGGKTDGMLGDWVSHADLYGQLASGLMVRRTRTELSDTIKRSQRLYTPLGAKFKEQDKEWHFPNKAVLKFAYLENDKDAEVYQGHSYTRVYVEEIGNFPREEPVLKLMATLRSADGVPVGFRATGNPGGPGHMWVKARYISNSPKGWTITKHKYINPFNGDEVTRDRVFIPSKLSDNQILMENDPGYVANLQMQGSPELVRAWLEGDWDIVAGTAFEMLSREKHIIRRFPIPEHWTKFTSLDWGTAKPYACGWYAVTGEDVVLKARDQWPERLIGKGSIIRYRELYGSNGKPNEGTREQSWQVARKINDAESELINYRIGDSAMWAEHDGPSAAENMQREFRDLENKCVAMEQSRKDRVANYLECRNRLTAEDGEEGFYTFDNSIHFWRTVPDLQLDQRDPEKGWDTTQEDHVADEWGYAMVSRPIVKDKRTYSIEKYDEARDKAFEAARGGKKGSRYN